MWLQRGLVFFGASGVQGVEGELSEFRGLGSLGGFCELRGFEWLSGFRVSGLGFKGFGASDVGLGVSGLGFGRKPLSSESHDPQYPKIALRNCAVSEAGPCQRGHWGLAIEGASRSLFGASQGKKRTKMMALSCKPYL